MERVRGFGREPAWNGNRDADTTAIDLESPPAGTTYHYVVGAENGCGRGSVGTNSTGSERSAGACP